MFGSGAFWFGLVVGFISYRTLHHVEKTAVSDIAAVIGAVGGAAVIKLFPVGDQMFDFYAFGLAVGVFGYLIISIVLSSKFGAAAAKSMLSRQDGTSEQGEPKTF